jgi:hypothetical protein
VKARDEVFFTDEVRADLLRLTNPHRTHYLSGVLPFYRGMRLLLYSKLCVLLGLVNGAECVLEDIIFAADEELPKTWPLGSPEILKYMPVALLLRATHGKPWVLPASELPKLPEGYDRQRLFLLRPGQSHLDYKLDAANTLEVRRTQFEVLPAGSRVIYAAQGEGFAASVADMKKPPTMNDREHWLGNYVLVSRAETLEGLLLLRLCSREHLNVGPPQYVVDEIKRLKGLECATLERLRRRVTQLKAHLSAGTLAVLRDIFGGGEMGKTESRLPSR